MYKDDTKIQIIRRSCCNTIFAGAVEPHCYTDDEWINSLKDYVQKGCKVEYIEAGKGLKFEECRCTQNDKR